MKNRRKKLAAMMLVLAMAGTIGAGGFQAPGILTVMAGGTEESTEEQTEDAAKESEAKESEEEAAVTETVEEPQVAITITAPEGWQKEKATVNITAEDAKNTGNFTIAKMEARISEDGSWIDVTSSKSIEVSQNSSVYVKITDQNGKVYTENRYIECFDTTKPTLSAAAKDGVLMIRGEDADSGVAAIYVNGNEFTELTDNTLNVRLQQADTTYEHFTLQARDKAGNMSENYKVANPYYENPDTKKADEGSTNTANAGTTNTSTTDTTAESTGSSSGALPTDATASKPTSATGTVTEHTESSTPDSTDAVSDTTQTGNAVPGTTKESGKEFYTITTKGDKVFYLIVDKDKTSDNVYLLTEVGENDLLNFTDGNTVTLPQNSAVNESALPDTDELEMEETETKEKTEKEEVKEPEKSSNAGTYVMIVLVLLGVGGAYYYLKFIKGRRDSFEEGYDDEDELEDAYETEMIDLDDSDEYQSEEDEESETEPDEDADDKKGDSDAEEYGEEEDYL